MERPQTRYVAVGDDNDVAYQVFGNGPTDLLYFHGLGSHFEHFWDLPSYARLLLRLAAFNRVILFDRRGTGGSGRVPSTAIPTWEAWADDIRAVLDAAGSRCAAVVAAGDAGPIAILFAAMHPQRVNALVLFNTTARYLVADDYPIGLPPEVVELVVEGMKSVWGTPEAVQAVNPGMRDDPEFVACLARMFRSAATPRMAAAQYDYIMRSLDVRRALPLLQAETAVIHVRDTTLPPRAQGRYLAEHIAGAKFVELPGQDFAMVANGDIVVDEIAEFLTGERPVVAVDRVLSTVLFTDIVGSTERAASLGDQRWRYLLDSHNRVVREQLRRFRGREVKTTGDGFVACFDGPARAISCAADLVEATRELGVEIRIGMHTGECDVRGDDLGGLAVHIAARVGALSGPGEVLVSSTVKDLVIGSGIEFSERGVHVLKGVPDTWRLFALEGLPSAP
jgi:class 3 adenylate cyclase